MSFRLWMIFYVFALVAASMATFGPAGGIAAAGVVLSIWTSVFMSRHPLARLKQIVIVVLILSLLLALMSSSVQATSRISKRGQCGSHLTAIVEGLLNYEAANGKLPPAYVTDPNGRPMHSWRVLILPYMEGYGALYKKYNFNEPWDGPSNRKLASQIPPVYRCPSDTTFKPNESVHTNYFAVVGPETAMPEGVGIKIHRISDGTSNTIAIIEASGIGVNWMEPRDLTIDEAVELLTGRPQSGHQRESDGFLTETIYETPERFVAWWDGTVEFFSPLSEAKTARAMLTASGREPNGSFHEKFIEPKVTTMLKWGKVWALSVFVVLSLLPGMLLRRQLMVAREWSLNEQGDASERVAGEPLARG